MYLTDIGLIKQTINRTSRCNKVDAVRLYASCRLNLLLQRCVREVGTERNRKKKEKLRERGDKIAEKGEK